MRDDLYGALKNALEHGDNVEKAIQSLISAGYKESEVREVAQLMSNPAFAVQHEMPSQAPPKASAAPVAQVVQTFTPQTQPLPTDFKIKKKTDWKIIVLCFILFLLVLSLVLSILFKDQIISLFNSFLQ